MFDRTREFLDVTAIDFQNASHLEKLAFFGSLAVVGGHLFGAETLYSNIGTGVFKDTDKANIALNALATGAAVGATSAALETASTLVVSASVETFPRTANFLNKLYSARAKEESMPVEASSEEVTEPKSDNAESAQTLVASDDSTEIEGDTILEKVESGSLLLAIGSPGRVLRHYTRDPSKDFKQRVKSGIPAIKFLAKVNFGLGAGVALMTRFSHDIWGPLHNFILNGDTHQYADYVAPAVGVFPFIKDPLFWWTMFAGAHFGKKIFGNGSKKEATDLLINPLETN